MPLLTEEFHMFPTNFLQHFPLENIFHILPSSSISDKMQRIQPGLYVRSCECTASKRAVFPNYEHYGAVYDSNLMILHPTKIP